MPENNLIIKSVRRSSSFLRYSIRRRKDTCLHDDVENYLLHRQKRISCLVDKLMNDDFVLARHTDPTYPIL